MSHLDDYQAGLDGQRNYANKHTVAYHRGLADRAGMFSGSVAGSAPNFLGVLPAPMLLALSFLLATVGILIATCLFPLGGGLTLLAYYVFYRTFYDPMVSTVMLLMVFLLPGIFCSCSRCCWKATFR